MKTVGERVWYQFKKFFPRDVVEKKERMGHLQHATEAPKGRRSLGARFMPKVFDKLFKGRSYKRMNFSRN